MYPPTTSNQITKEYYNHLIGEQNRGTTKLRVCVVTRTNGSHRYETYHLVSCG